MIYVSLPIERIETGKPLPIDVFDPRGNLLLRRGQVIRDEQHRELLTAHTASATEPDYKAWVRSYDRQVYDMLRDGISLQQIAKATMPSTILAIDFAVGHDITGGWLDMQAVLHGMLYQGKAAKNPIARIDAIHKRAVKLIAKDADDALFSLFQALADPQLGYCATHGLLAAVLCELTANKLEAPDIVLPVLFKAALSMNIGMAREQDTLTRQNVKPDAPQQQLIKDHARISADILRGFGVVNEDLLDIVRLHHDMDEAQGLARNLECRRILHAADVFIARMSARANRIGLSAMGATKSGYVTAVGHDVRVGTAMANAIGFYPPGTYVVLANGEKAVSVKRGEAANTPLVVSILNPQGLALGNYAARDTRDKSFAIQSPASHDTIKVKVHPDRVARAVQKLQSSS